MESGVPRGISMLDVRPSTSLSNLGGSPLPGLIDRTFCAVKVSPFFRSSTTNSERLKILLAPSFSVSW